MWCIKLYILWVVKWMIHPCDWICYFRRDSSMRMSGHFIIDVKYMYLGMLSNGWFIHVVEYVILGGFYRCGWMFVFHYWGNAHVCWVVKWMIHPCGWTWFHNWSEGLHFSCIPNPTSFSFLMPWIPILCCWKEQKRLVLDRWWHKLFMWCQCDNQV
jgi:hypothetical protein